MKHDWPLILLTAAFYVIATVGFGYLAYLFVTVIFLGGGSSCPQNSCP